jgi:progressive ankylosis protein
MPKPADPTPRTILLFWFPLALQWIMMAVEGPFLAALIARLGDPTFNLAAYGVAYAFAILVEAPVIMLMSAATALVEDRHSYRKLRTFTWILNLLATGLLLLLLIPGVFAFVAGRALGLPDDVTPLLYGALWILLPWPAAIGYRRFLHGVLIRAGRTRRVALGTGVRLLAMAGMASVLARSGMPGAWVGAAALSTGVVVEAVTAWLMARDVVRGLGRPVGASGAMAGGGVSGGAEKGEGEAEAEAPLDMATLIRFYYPLVLMSFITLAAKPILTFFMGRAPDPVESLALFPVVMALYFLFGTLGLSYQEATIALLGRNGEHREILGRFGVGVALGASGMLALIAFTPLARLWFEGVSGLSPEFATLAFVPIQIACLAPAFTALGGFQRAVLVRARRTRPITVASAVEVSGIALLFPLLAGGLGWMGVTAAMGAFVGGRGLGVLFLWWQARRT